MAHLLVQAAQCSSGSLSLLNPLLLLALPDRSSKPSSNAQDVVSMFTAFLHVPGTVQGPLCTLTDLQSLIHNSQIT